MKNIAVVLSGCGVSDGSEVHESVLTLLSLDRCKVKAHCLAPDGSQRKVVNHYSQQEMDEQRNILVESARIARGDVKNIALVDPSDYDAAIFPGGFGAALNLCDYALAGRDCTLHPDVMKFAIQLVKSGKPLGFICIAPVMIPAVCGTGVKLTIGYDESVANDVVAMGGCHVEAAAGDIVVDEAHRVVSTPAYMVGECISDVAVGIDKLVDQVLQWA